MNNLKLLQIKIAEMYESAKIIESETGNPPTAFEALEWISASIDEIIFLEDNRSQEYLNQ